MSAGTTRRAVLSGVVVLWLFAVLVGYYLVHKPLALASFAALPDTFSHLLGDSVLQTLSAPANALGDAATASVCFVLAAALGHRLLRAWYFESELESVVLWLGVGLGALGLIAFTLAVIGIVNQWVWWGLIVAGLLLLRNDVRALVRAARTIELTRATGGDRALAAFCALVLAITFLFALTPPWGWDGLQYHLVAPKLILAAGRISPPPDNLSLNFPSLIEMLFLVGMTLKGDGATQLFHWIFLPLTLGALLDFTRRTFSWRMGWVACALYCAVPTVALLATWAYNDLALTFYTFTAFGMTLRARASGTRRDFVLIGILCGLAFGEKVTAFFLPLALAVLLFRRNRATLVNLALMCLVAGALAAVWWVRNLVFVGNPIYPFVFGGRYWDEFRTAWYTRFGSGLLARPLELLGVPWTMTVLGTQSDLFQANLGPLLLALLPLNLIRSPETDPAKRSATQALWFVAAVLYGAWLVGVAQSNLLWQARLLLPAFPFFCILAARGLEKLGALSLPQFSIQRFAAMVVAIVLSLTALSYTLAFFSDRAPGYFLGGVTRAQYLAGTLGAHYTAVEWLNANLPPDAYVLALWEPRTYYIARDAEADAILDRFVHLRRLNGNAAQIGDVVRGAGYTHVLLYREGLDNILQTGYDPITTDDVETLDQFVRDELVPVYGAPTLGLETRDGRSGLKNVQAEPYSIYKIRTP